MSADEDRYKAAGVDTAIVETGLRSIIHSIKGTWPTPASVGAVQLDIGYFANVIDIGGIGLAICTDGVGSKSVVAQMMNKYDTIGVDCVAMNVNDLICVGARPISMVDYIAVETADADMLGAIGVGLAEGARQAGISISGGEISVLKDVMRGFDLVGMAVGLVPLDRIVSGHDLVPGDVVIGIDSDGIHSNGLTLARHALFDAGGLTVRHVFPELGIPLGEELLRPTPIYVREALDIIEQVPGVKALVNITGDGLLNLPRVAAKVGFEIDDMPPASPIFGLIQRHGQVGDAEMFQVYNMGVGFCVLAAERDAAAVLSILDRHGRRAQIIGRVIADDRQGVYLPRQKLAGHGKKFCVRPDDLSRILAALSRGARRPAYPRAALCRHLVGGSVAGSGGRAVGLAVARRRSARRLCLRVGRPSRVREKPARDLRPSVLVARQRFSYAGLVPVGPARRGIARGKAMTMVPLIDYGEANAEVRAVYDDIMRTRGTDWINNFWKALANDPPTLRRTWESIKAVMAPGALDPLTKELLYLAVSVTNGCAYCTASHGAAARKAGMTREMLGELLAVVGMANETNALANGYRVPVDERFEKLF